jgi:hypothetical protein
MGDTPTLPGRRLQHDVIGVTPGPVLPRLVAPDQRVLRPVEVLGGMLSRRGVTAADVSTGETEPEMDPLAPGLKALLATIRRMRDHRSNLIKMRALHRRSSLTLSLECRSIPPPQVGSGLVGGLEKLEQQLVGTAGGPDRLIR